MESNAKNTKRFDGFADIYDYARPSTPQEMVDIIKKYVNSKISTVVDLGCGTGLSIPIWSENCDKIIGVEPNKEMLEFAKAKNIAKASFVNFYADETGIEDSSCDVVVCSQSFHWMNPISTLKEVDRILKKGGVFATIDCDWPPVTNLDIEMEYASLDKYIRDLEKKIEGVKNSFVRYEKNNHLENILSSDYFNYVREISFMNTQEYTPDRFKKLLLSQGSLQEILKQSPHLINQKIENFERNIDELCTGMEKIEISLCYKMRIAVK